MLQVQAYDWDRSADLEYSIVEPITARDKTGNALSNKVRTKNQNHISCLHVSYFSIIFSQASYDFTRAFYIDPVQGTLVVQEPLSHTSAAVVILTIQVVDKNADDLEQPTEEGEPPINKQIDTGGVFFQEKSKISFLICCSSFITS